MKTIFAGIAILLVSASASMAQNIGQIKNVWKGSYLNMQTGAIQSTPIEQDWQSAKWELIKVQDGQFKIKNVLKGTFLNIENGPLQCTAIKDDWYSARWTITKVSGIDAIRINNFWKPQLFINIENGGPACSEIKDDWYSARWNWEGSGTNLIMNNLPETAPANMNSSNNSFILESLAAHNTLRKEVGVAPLTWSVWLAVKAQAWADNLAKRNMGEGKWDIAHSQAPDIGENIVIGDGGFNGPSDGILLWGDEKKNFDPNSRKCKSGVECGHYTQAVWRKTTQVGCAVAINPNGRYIMVCNYNPPGNFNNEPAF